MALPMFGVHPAMMIVAKAAATSKGPCWRTVMPRSWQFATEKARLMGLPVRGDSSETVRMGDSLKSRIAGAAVVFTLDFRDNFCHASIWMRV